MDRWTRKTPEKITPLQNIAKCGTHVYRPIYHLTLTHDDPRATNTFVKRLDPARCAARTRCRLCRSRRRRRCPCQHKGTTRIEIEIEKRTHNCALAWRARDNRNWWARGGQFALRTPHVCVSACASIVYRPRTITPVRKHIDWRRMRARAQR